jgi:ParB/RepB/Spo0J family partition protein
MERPKFTLETIEIPKIEPNPDNPRGPRVRDNDDQFSYLKRSIKEFGLIVPLVVQELKGAEKKYRLVDGERRYQALKELGIKTAPAHVIIDEINNDEVKNIMFHIHTNRVQWDPCQQCKALEPLYKKLKNEFGENEKEIAMELVKLTGTNKRTVNDRLNFLRWPTNIKDKVYTDKADLYWTIAEIEGGIIKPAEKNFPEYFKKVSKDDVREWLLKKYINGIVHAATEARKVKCIVRTLKEDKEQHKYALEILSKLVDEIDYTFEDAQEEFLAKFPEADKVMKPSYKNLLSQLLKVITILKDRDILLLFIEASVQEKKQFKEILEELEKAFEDFKRESQELL